MISTVPNLCLFIILAVINTATSLNSADQFLNQSIKIAGFDSPPYLKVQGQNIFGIEKDIVDYLTKDFAVSFVVNKPYSWDLNYDLLQNESVDVALGGHGRDFVDHQKFVATASYMSHVGKLLVPKPKLLPAATFLYQPLYVSVWVAAIATAFVIPFLLSKTARYIQDYSNTSYSDFLFKVIGTILLNSQSYSIKHIFLEQISFLINAFAVLLWTFYSAGVTSGLTYPRFTKPIDTYKDILDNSLTYDVESIKLLLQTCTVPYAADIGNRDELYQPNIESQFYVGFLYNKFVFLQKENLARSTKRMLKLLNEDIQEYDFVFVLQKNSPLTETFNFKIYRLVEHGLVIKWFRMDMFRNFEELREMSWYYSYYSDISFSKSPLNLLKLQGAFYACTIGFISAFVVFVIERLAGKNKLVNA